MNRIDRIVLGRFVSRIALTLVLFFSLFALIESLDTGRFALFTKLGGPLLALLGIVAGSLRSVIGTLPVTVLLGTMLAALDLQSRRELTIIKATGTSIWGVVRAPLLFTFVAGTIVALVGDGAAINLSRTLPYTGRSGTSNMYLEQTGSEGPYILHADSVRKGGRTLDGVSLFFTRAETRDRIIAESATLSGGAWQLANVTRYLPGQTPEHLDKLSVPTQTTNGDMQVRTTVARDLTVLELMGAVGNRIGDPVMRAAAFTSLLRLFAMPAMLCGSVLMGFAFTAGYRRNNRFGGTILYGVVLGFVVYVVTELAIRAGFAGVVDPAFAAAGPAFVAIVIGLTVLLYKEDGQA